MEKGVYGLCSTTFVHPGLYNFPDEWIEVGLCEERFAASIKKVQSWLCHYCPIDSTPTRVTSMDGSLPELSDEGIAQRAESTLSPLRKVSYLTSLPAVSLDLVETHQPKQPEEQCPQPDKEELRFNMKLRQLRARQNRQDKKTASITSNETPKNSRVDISIINDYSPEVCPSFW